MKQIYKALNNCIITLKIINNIEVQSIVKINDVIFDDVILASGENNTRVLEIDLKKDDIVFVSDSENVKYLI